MKPTRNYHSEIDKLVLQQKAIADKREALYLRYTALGNKIKDLRQKWVDDRLAKLKLVPDMIVRITPKGHNRQSYLFLFERATWRGWDNEDKTLALRLHGYKVREVKKAPDAKATYETRQGCTIDLDDVRLELLSE